MRVEVNVLESGTEPGVSVQHQPALMMALRTGSIEVGSRRSEMMRFTFGAGEMCLVPRHVETWLRTDELHYLYLSVDISDAALAAACDGTRGDVELHRVGKLVDARVGALAAAVNAERVAGLSRHRERSGTSGSVIGSARHEQSVASSAGAHVHRKFGDGSHQDFSSGS